MTIKANAHFVDCDGSTGDGGEWETTRSGTRAAEHKITYISENSAIWGIPFNYSARTTLTLDAAGEARDVGGGIVGLPCLGHPFGIGDVVRIVGTTNYDGAFTLGAGTTNSELQITDTYVAETFDGTETVVQYIGSLISGAGRMCQDSVGNLYYGHNWDAVNSTYITKIETDGTKVYDFLNHSWPTISPSGLTGGSVYGLAISSNDQYLYVWIKVPTDWGYMEKYDLTTGDNVWVATPLANPTYDMAIDASGNAYGAMLSTKTTAKFASADGAQTYLTDSQGIYNVWVDNDWSVVITAGYMLGETESNLWIRKLDDSAGDEMAVGGTYNAPPWQTYIIGTGALAVYDGYIYVLSFTPTCTLYKIAWDGMSLSVVNSVAGPTHGQGLYFDLCDNLVVVAQDWTVGQTEIFWYYDTDLAAISSIDGYYNLMFRAWDAAVGGAWSQGNVVFDYGTSGGSATIDWSNVQGRTVAYPSGYGHLEGETVQVLGDGIYLGTETVVNGNIALDDNTTVNHVGLQFTSKLQPMKIEGEAQVKRIRQLIPDVFESVGGDYGESEADLYTMSLRDENDPMDIDGDLYTGYLELPFKGSYNRQGDLWVTQNLPLPMNILGLAVKLATVENK